MEENLSIIRPSDLDVFEWKPSEFLTRIHAKKLKRLSQSCDALILPINGNWLIGNIIPCKFH